jgi:hypothetical protein
MFIPYVIHNQTHSMKEVLAGLLKSYINHPDVQRPRGIAAIRSLSGPMPAIGVKELRKAFKRFQTDGDISQFLEQIETISSDTGAADQSPQAMIAPAKMIERGDLRLICFDVISG